MERGRGRLTHMNQTASKGGAGAGAFQKTGEALMKKSGHSFFSPDEKRHDFAKFHKKLPHFADTRSRFFSQNR